MGKCQSPSIPRPKASLDREMDTCSSGEGAQQKPLSNARKPWHLGDGTPQQSLVPARDKTSFWCKLHHFCSQTHEFSRFRITQSHSRLT